MAPSKQAASAKKKKTQATKDAATRDLSHVLRNLPAGVTVTDEQHDANVASAERRDHNLAANAARLREVGLETSTVRPRIDSALQLREAMVSSCSVWCPRVAGWFVLKYMVLIPPLDGEFILTPDILGSPLVFGFKSVAVGATPASARGSSSHVSPLADHLDFGQVYRRLRACVSF